MTNLNALNVFAKDVFAVQVLWFARVLTENSQRELSAMRQKEK